MFVPAFTRRLTAVFVVCLAFAPSVNATPIDAAALNDIYGQASFGASPLEIRVQSAREIVSPSLFNINISFNFNDPFDNGELDVLFALGGPAPSINVFFVNSLQSVFGPLLGIAQSLPTGSRGNNVAILNSLTTTLDEVVAHEIGHTLDLDHETGIVGTPGPFDQPDVNFPNLMSVFANGDTTLNPSQVATIFDSPFVQGNVNDGFFIDVQPINIVFAATATPVPTTSSLTFILLGCAALGVATRGKIARLR